MEHIFPVQKKITQQYKLTILLKKEYMKKKFPQWCMGLMASWEHWDTGSTPGLVQWVKDPALPQLQLRL